MMLELSPDFSVGKAFFDFRCAFQRCEGSRGFFK